MQRGDAVAANALPLVELAQAGKRDRLAGARGIKQGRASTSWQPG
jgi:hypothetical protein